MRRQLPILVVFISGLFMAVQYFIPSEPAEFVQEYAMDWVIVIGVFAMGLGLWSLTEVNWAKIQKRAPGWGYNGVTILGMLFMLVVGLVWDPGLGFFPGSKSQASGTWFMNFFWYIYLPIQAVMFSLLAFYIASAAYRAFRARTILASILLVTAIVIMLRLIPLGAASGVNQWLANWILVVPNMAAKRAIWMGVGLGGVAMALKIVLGIERSYMGRD